MISTEGVAPGSASRFLISTGRHERFHWGVIPDQPESDATHLQIKNRKLGVAQVGVIAYLLSMPIRR